MTQLVFNRIVTLTLTARIIMMLLPTTLWAYFLAWAPSWSTTPQHDSLTFHLRHLYAHNASRVLFHNLLESTYSNTSSESPLPSYSLRTRKVKTHKARSREAYEDARTRSIRYGESAALDWDEYEVNGPDVESRETLLKLAKMTYDAYIEPEDDDWYELGEEWTGTFPVGWEPDEDGFRGYVFSTEDNSTVVLSIKGTSAGLFGGGGPTAKKDKLNDNLLFSCCCAHVDWTWTPVCDCYRGGWNCSLSCLQEALVEDSLFYPIGTNLYYNITYMYPDADIWIVGHSLGGALASLLGATFGVPVVAFESPGERMASRRLHLPQPPTTNHITHIYHTADPIATGTCTGIFSSCFLSGYAMESRCHLGSSIIYDTMTNLSWRSDVRTHGIRVVVEGVLGEEWEDARRWGREVPGAVGEGDCVECYDWEFED